MSDTPRAPSGRRGPALALGAVGLLLGGCVVLPAVYAVADYDYVRGTARQIQDAAVVASWAASYGLVALIALAAAAGVVAIVGLYHRWAAPAARVDATAIALARAAHMELPDGLSSLTLQAPREKAPLQVQLQEPAGTQTVIDALPEPPPPPPHEAFVYGVSRVKQLVERGDIVAGSDAIVVGYAGQRPAAIRAGEWGLAVVAGQSGKGKSSLAKLIIAQAVLHGWVVMVCDPVYHRQERSLLRHFLPGLSGALYRQAVRPAEIAATIGLAMKIAQRRLDHGETGPRVLLVVDEFATVAGRKMLDEAAMGDFFLTATKASGAGVHTLLIAHDLKGDWFGGKSARQGRDQLTHRLVCNMVPDAAESILPAAEYARQVAMLPVGQALFFDGWDAPSVVAFPQLSADDLAWAAGGKPPKPYQPWQPAALAPAPPATTAPAPPLPPTVPLPAPAPPRAAPPTTVITWTTREKILDVLARHPAGLDAQSIADAIGEGAPTVKSRLGELRGEGAIDARKAPAARHFLYFLVRRPPAA